MNKNIGRSPEAERPSVDQYFELHYARLTGLAQRVVAVRATAEEVAADALTRLTHDPVLSRPAPEVAAWLNRVTVNGALNRLRSQQRYDARLRELAFEFQGTNAQTVGAHATLDPATAVGRTDEQQRVRRILAELPERQATAVLLRHAGYSYAEIAATLTVATGSVGVLLARGEQRFAELWAKSRPN